ncbi:MAG: carotenoid biosynthesis protein [Melioribacteraceae bacterium]|nr:MAG: carotenoid biosynthesis protein [Melioribacteraceae bacterium]
MSHKSTLIVLYVVYAVGIIGHLFTPTREYMLMLTPYTLLLTGGIVLSKVLPHNITLVKWIVIVYIVTFALEVFGVKTGLLFGSYEYGDVLGPKLFETPLIIGFNWVLVILGGVLLSSKFISNNFLIVLFTPLLTVLFDFFLEPVAIKLNYWMWFRGEIPVQNYLAWYAISLLAVFFFMQSKIEVKSTIPIHYFAIQIFFFLSLNIML